jgi:tetratricopeptide (TPR) repeat protein
MSELSVRGSWKPRAGFLLGALWGAMALAQAVNPPARVVPAEPLAAPAEAQADPETPEAIISLVRRNPADPSAHRRLAAVYARAENWFAAIASLEQALRLDPDYFEGYTALGDVYSKIGRWPDVVRAFREALRIVPNSIEARTRLAEAYVKTYDLEKAAATYRQIAAFSRS